MEINHFGNTILGVVAVEDVVEGRMVCLTSHTWNNDFGGLTDLPGAKLPATAAEAAKARYCITFPQDNRTLPIYQPQASYSYALRYGFDQSANTPFSATVYLTHPNNQEGLTIPSGAGALAFGEGVYTVPAGSFVYSSALETPGTQLEVAYTGSDKGKLQELSGGTAVAEVVGFNSDEFKLTFKILH